MVEFVSKITLITKEFLNNEDFVARQLIETDDELKFIIVSGVENIDRLNQEKGAGDARSFLKKIVKMLNIFAKENEINKMITIETEVMHGRNG